MAARTERGRTMRILGGIIAAAALAACAPTLPDSGAGAGYGDYASYERDRVAREAELRGGAAPSIAASQSQMQAPAISAAELSAAGLPVATSDPAQPLPVQPSPAQQPGTAAVDLNNPGISDEQDFQAVSSRISIESDKERLRAQRQAYQVVPPTAVPQRPADVGPNIVSFALNTTNRRGEPVYRRSGFMAESRFNRACARYASPDLAQEAFLAAGGPERDRQGMDPDGDGFACYWDPAPFRQAAR